LTAFNECFIPSLSLYKNRNEIKKIIVDYDASVVIQSLQKDSYIYKLDTAND
jgi:hypothetical protein